MGELPTSEAESVTLAAENLFAGPGEMRARCRAYDWDATAPGAVDDWPPSLRVLAPLTLSAGVPSALFWGAELTLLYNDAYIPLMGALHPGVLGRPHFDVVPESRATFEPLFARVRSGETVNLADVPTTFRRDGLDGPATTSFYTFSFAPVRDVDDPAGPVIGIHGIVLETTSEVARRATDARQAYLLALSDALRPLVDPVAIQGEAARLLGERLGANRALYTENEADEVVIRRDWVRGLPSMVGRYPASAWGSEFVATYLRGDAFVVDDVATDPRLDDTDRSAFRAAAFAAFIGVGLVKEGRLVGAFGVQSTAPRVWTAEEVELVRETAERTWAAVERARAELALRTSEAKYRTIFDSIDEGFGTHEVLYDDAGSPVDIRYLETNAAYERHTGVSGCVGRTAREILPHLEDVWIETFARVARTGEPLRSEQYNEGTGRWYNVYLARVGDDGRPVVAAVFNDITGRKLAEDALTAAAARDAFLVRLADVLRPLADPVTVQAEAARLLGEHLRVNHAHYGEVTGDTVVVHQSYANAMPSMVGAFDLAREGWGARLLDTYRAGRTAVCYDVHTDPTITPAEVAVLSGAGFGAYVGVPLLKEGEWVAVLAVETIAPRVWTPDEVELLETVAERTWAAVERARAEAALNASEGRYRTLVDNVLDYGIFGLDSEGVITTWTLGAERVKGYRADEVLGRHFALFYIPEDIAAGVPTDELARAAASGRAEGEGWRVRKGGMRFWGNEIATAVRGTDGCLLGFTKIVRDLTERRAAEEAAERARAAADRDALRHRLLNAEEDERRRLSRELHDEAGQHLTALGLGLQALSNFAVAGSEVERRTTQLRELANTLGRELHAIAVRLRPRALDDFGLERALSAHAEEWSRQTGIHVDVHVRQDAARLPMATESAVYRVVQEALTNIALHSGATHASIVLERHDGQVVAVVEDNGRGFDHENGAPAVDVPGLGLLGVRERVDLLGGTVAIESAPGSGTSLYVRIPVTAPSNGSHDHL